MTYLTNTIFLLIIFILGLIANKLDNHIKPTNIVNPLLFNIGKMISYSLCGVLLGFIGFILKINGAIGGFILIVIYVIALIVTLSYIPIFPKIVILGLQSHNHSKNSFTAGLLNIFSSSATIHIVMAISIAHGYYLESGIIFFFFFLGTIYIPSRNITNKNKVYKVFQVVLFFLSTLFILQKGLLYTEKFMFSPFEGSKTAIVPEILNNIQFLKTDISDLNNRILVTKGYDVNWMIIGEKKGDSIYIPRFRHKTILNDSNRSLVINSQESGFIYFTTKLGKGDYKLKVLDNKIDVYNLPYKKVLDSGYGDDIHGSEYVADQGVPDIKIVNFGIATINNSNQVINIEITKNGYNPSVIVLKKGIPATLNFVGKEITEVNRRIIMPSYNEYLEFSEGNNPINMPDPLIDFIYYSWKGDFGGYVLIVDQVEEMTLSKVERQIRMLNVNGI